MTEKTIETLFPNMASLDGSNPQATKKVMKSLYGGDVKIVFYPDSHRYKLEGENGYLISVTACTGIIDKSRVLIPWAVGLAEKHIRSFIESNTGPFGVEELIPIIEEAVRQHQIRKDEAASIGGMVHAYAEAFALAVIAKQEVPQIPEDADDRVRAGINAFLNWFVSNDVQFLHAEKLVYSPTHGFAGLVDAVANVNGKPTLIDYKTSKGVYTEMRYQVAAYCLAFEEEHGKSLEGALILQFDKETGICNQHPLTQDELSKDSSAFLACLALKKRERELAKV